MRIVHDARDHRIFMANTSLAEDVIRAVGVSQMWRFHAYRALPSIAQAATPTEGSCNSCINKGCFKDRRGYSYKCQNYEKIVQSEPASYYDPRIEACGYRNGSKCQEEAIEDVDGDCCRVLGRVDIVRQRPIKEDSFGNARHCLLK